MADIEQNLDRVVSLLVRLLNPQCVLCGETDWDLLQNGHFFPRHIRPTRWHMDNLATLCSSCNYAHEERPQPYRAWILKKLGQNRLSELAELANSHHKFTWIELTEMLAGFKAVLAEVKKKAA